MSSPRISLKDFTRTMIFGLSALLLSWLLMQLVHELGHVAGALATGGNVTHVEVNPLSISRTDVNPNPAPRIVLWFGPIGGCLAPLLLWLMLQTTGRQWAFLARFFAGFCLVANGAYLGAAIAMPVGDAHSLMNLGTPVWQLALFGAIAVPAGFVMWNGLGREFGIGPESQSPSGKATAFLATSLIVLAVLEWFYSAL